MAKSWKKLVNTTDPDSNGAGGENSWNNAQLTLDELAAQNPELDNLIKERQGLENNMSHLLQSGGPAAEDPRFAGGIDSFKVKREREKQRAAQKKKLEERLSLKSKELEKWEQAQERLKEKVTHHKKLLKKQGTEQDPSTSLDALRSKKGSERNWFNTDFVRKYKDVIGKKNEVQSKLDKAKTKVSDEIQKRKAAASDIFGQKDLVKFQQKLDQKNTPEVDLKRIRSIKDNWAKIRETKKDELKEELKEKIAIQKLSDKLAEAKRFKPLSELEGLSDFSDLKDPKIRDLDKKQEKEKSLDDRPKSAEDKQEEKQEMSRREKRKEQRKEKREERRNRDSDEPKERRKKKKDESETDRQTPESDNPSAKKEEQEEMSRREKRKEKREEKRAEKEEKDSAKKDEQRETDRREKQKEESISRRKAERKEEERSNRRKERKKDKYD